VEVDRVITCIDCGGRAHLISYEPEDGWTPGDVVVYRCEDCHDRWDLVVPDEEGNVPDDP
jgi:DNA-directed RNA polymerase subunit RPC12/RpoP